MSIKQKLIIIFLAISIIPLFFVSVVSYSSARKALEDATLEGLNVIAEFKESEVLLYVDELKERTEIFASDRFIRDSLEEINNPGSTGFATVKELNAYLSNDKMSLVEDILKINILNLEGRVVASTDPESIGQDKSGRPYFIAGKNDTYVQDLHFELDKEGNRLWELEIAVPLRARGNSKRIIGVLVNHFDGALFNKTMIGQLGLELGALTQARGMGETGEHYLVNKERIMITDALFLKDAAFRQKVDTYPVEKCLEEGLEVSGIWRDYRGVSVAGASMCITIGDFKLALISVQDEAEAFARIAHLKRLVFIVGGVTFLFVGLTAVVTAKTLSDPIRTLQKGTDEIGKGNLDYRVGTSANDEIGQLSRDIDRMAGNLAKVTALRDEYEREVAERKKAEHAYKESSTKLTTILETTVDAIITIDEKGIVQAYNLSAEQLFGYSGKEVVGNNVSMLMPSPHRENHNAYIARYLETGEKKIIGCRREFIGQRKDGTAIPLELAVSEVELFGERTFTGIISDIKERKQLEESLKREKNTAEEANRLKSEFLANMSHELRTPLNAIIGFSEILKDGVEGELTEDQTDLMNDIFTSGVHLLSLINDILDLSKIEAGKAKLNLETVNIAEILENSLVIVTGRALKHNIKLNLDGEEGIGAALLDARKFKQIIYNLLSNAVKFTGDGGSVSIKAGRSSSRGEDFFEVSVVDTGMGIAKEDLKRVFNPFVQLESSLTRRHEGTGLGLAMAKRLVEMHGGTIKVESELSRGSTFTVIMPYKAKHREETEVEKADQGSEVPTTGISRDERPLVLIIEDDNPSAELLRSQLETENYRTIRAATAKEGYELAKQHKPDLITLDIMLPGEVDGWELLKGLEDDDTLKTIPVVIVSIAADEQKGFALGASKVLHKPLGKEEFIAAVKSIGVLPSGSEKQATVLVVDDDPRSVEVVSHYLKGLGCEVLRAYGGQEGIDMAIKDKPDLILLDLMMPDVSGFDVVDRLRKIPESSGIPIIIVTAKILTREDIETLNSSVTKIVRKGRLDVDGFLTEVKRAMRSSSINEG